MFWRKKNISVGNSGEEEAERYLKKKGYKVIGKNFFNTTGRRLGEIDIIALDGKELVFVEVKTRKGLSGDTLPEESITPSKIYKLNKIAQYYIKKNNLWDCSYRFDAISIWIGDDQRLVKVRHLRSIFY